MAQVIIYANENGGVSVCYPTGELSIEETKLKDTPVGSIIVDDSELPTENKYFNAWELVNGQVIVNEIKKQAIIDANQAKETAQQSAIAKLSALGLSAEEIASLGVK